MGSLATGNVLSNSAQRKETLKSFWTETRGNSNLAVILLKHTHARPQNLKAKVKEREGRSKRHQDQSRARKAMLCTRYTELSGILPAGKLLISGCNSFCCW